MGQEVGESVRQSNCKAMHGSPCWHECKSSFDCKAPMAGYFINVEVPVADQELLFDTLPEEDLSSFDGMSRVQELENILGEILDLWDEDILTANPSTSIDEEEVESVFDVFDRAGAILAKEDYE